MVSQKSSGERSLTGRILGAMALGVVAGVLIGPSTAALGIAGKLFIQLIKVMAVPLVFFSIVDALVTTTLTWGAARNLISVVVINTTIALTIGLVRSNLVLPGPDFAGRLETLEGPYLPHVDC